MSHSVPRASSYEGHELRWVPGPGAGGSLRSQPWGGQSYDEPGGWSRSSAARRIAVDLAGDLALQNPDDLRLGTTFVDRCLGGE
jgi:hypothetical protein